MTISQDTGEFLQLEPNALDALAALLSEPQRWPDWLASLDDVEERSEGSQLLSGAYKVVCRLEFLSDWPFEEVLAELGCNSDAEAIAAMDEDELRRCLDYFSWVDELVRLTCSVEDAQLVISGAARLFKDARGSLEACRMAVRSGGSPATELLRLGETDRAWATARLHLEGRVGDRARHVMNLSPFGAESPHLTIVSLDRLRRRDAGGANPEMRGRLLDHIGECSACDSFVRDRLNDDASLAVTF